MTSISRFLPILLLLTNCTSSQTDEEKGVDTLEGSIAPQFEEVEWLNDEETVSPGSKLILGGTINKADQVELDYSVSNLEGVSPESYEKGLTIKMVDPKPGQGSYDLQEDGKTQIAVGDEACNGNYIFRLSMSSDDFSDSRDLSFSITGARDCPGGSTMALNELEGEIYNILGPNPGAFDLAEGKMVAIHQANGAKDLLDQTFIGSKTAGGGFSRILGSANGASFLVNPANLDANQLSQEAIQKAWSQGSAQATTPPLNPGDLVLVQLNPARGKPGIFLLRIESVDTVTGPSERKTNGGIIRFKYSHVHSS